jgi:hypothetical protein
MEFIVIERIHFFFFVIVIVLRFPGDLIDYGTGRSRCTGATCETPTP